MFLLRAALALFATCCLIDPAAAQNEFSECTTDAIGRLNCRGLVCEANAANTGLECNSGLQCAFDRRNAVMHCSNGRTYDSSGRAVSATNNTAAPTDRPRPDSRATGAQTQGISQALRQNNCSEDGSGLFRCGNGFVCQLDRGSGLLRCNNGTNRQTDASGLVRCNNGQSSMTNGGVTRFSNGGTATTDGSGLTRFSDGTSCITDQSGLTRCFPRR